MRERRRKGGWREGEIESRGGVRERWRKGEVERGRSRGGERER